MKISFFQYISQKNRLILYNLLADLLGDGIPLYTALQLVESEDGERVYGKQFIRQLRFILSKMKDSSSVTEVLSEVVPPQDLTVINAAEKSGQLLNGLRMLVSMIEKNNELMVLLRKALVTPIILLLVVLFVIMGYSVKVFPTFIGVMPVNKWPEVTKNLYGFGDYLYKGGMITVVVGAAAAVFLIRLSMPLFKGPLRNLLLDKVPPYNYYRVLQLGLFLRMLSTLMMNGIPMVDALSLMKQRASPWMGSHIDKFIHNMKSGRSYKESLDTGFLTPEMLLTVSVYSGMDSFSETVKKMAEKCDVEIVKDIEKLSGLLKNLSLISLAGSVIWIFTAIFSLVDKLGSGFS